MEREFFTCGICSLVLWDPVFVPCCKSPFCYSCLLSRKDQTVQEGSHFKCAYCGLLWLFYSEDEMERLETYKECIEIEVEKLKVSKDIKALVESYYNAELKQRITEHFKKGLAKVQRRSSSLRNLRASRSTEDEVIVANTFGDEDAENEEIETIQYSPRPRSSSLGSISTESKTSSMPIQIISSNTTILSSSPHDGLRNSFGSHVTKNLWMPDDASPECTECRVQFSLINRRHHCRQCGLLFCAECSKYLINIPAVGKARACKMCYNSNLQDMSCTYFMAIGSAQREKFRSFLEQTKGKWVQNTQAYKFAVLETTSSNQIKFIKARVAMEVPLHKVFEWFWKLYKKNPSEKKITMTTKYFSPSTSIQYGKLIEDDTSFCWLKSYEVDMNGACYICTVPVQYQDYSATTSLAQIECISFVVLEPLEKANSTQITLMNSLELTKYPRMRNLFHSPDLLTRCVAKLSAHHKGT